MGAIVDSSTGFARQISWMLPMAASRPVYEISPSFFLSSNSTCFVLFFFLTTLSHDCQFDDRFHLVWLHSSMSERLVQFVSLWSSASSVWLLTPSAFLSGPSFPFSIAHVDSMDLFLKLRKLIFEQTVPFKF